MSGTTYRLARIGLLLLLVVTVGCPFLQSPVLSVTPVALSFSGTGDRSSFQIANTGGGTLRWQLEESVTWMFLTEQVGGSDVEVTQGKTTDETDVITAHVVRTDLPAGTYNAEITISSNGGTQKVLVSMQVTSPARLAVSPALIDLGEVNTRASFTVENTGTLDLKWNASVSSTATWLTVRPLSDTLSTGKQTVEVQVDRTGLRGGTHEAEITISSNGGTATVAVRIFVPERLLIVTPAMLDFGTSSVLQTFDVRNGGVENMAWNVVTSELPAFVTVSPTEGNISTGSQAVNVAIDRNAMGFAYNTRNEVPLTLTSFNGGGTAQVTLVISVGAFSISPATLDTGAADTQGTFVLRNHSTAPINWTATEDVPWILQVTPSGTAASGATSDIAVTVSRTGLTPGDYTGSVTVTSAQQTQVLPVLMTVPPPPTLVATPLALDFRSDLTDKIVAMWNSGVGTVNWTIDTQGLPAWLSLVFNGNVAQGTIQGALTGQATDSLRVSVDRAGLPPSKLTASIPITATDQSGAALAPHTITVDMTVAAFPVLDVNTGDVQGELLLGAELTQGVMTLRNLGTGNLTWSIDDTKFPSWLTVVPKPLEGSIESNTGSAVLTVGVNRTSMASGDYGYGLQIESNAGAVLVNVSMTVPQPVLTLSPASLTMGATQTSSDVILSNSGCGQIVFAVSVPAEFKWLKATPTEGTLTCTRALGEPAGDSAATMTVSVDRSVITEHGNHDGYVTISWNDDNVTKLPVQVTVLGPVLSVAPQAVFFGPSDTQTTLAVTNAGDTERLLTWNITKLPLPWSSVDKAVGTTKEETDTVEMTVNRAGLDEGTYQGDLIFTSNDGGQTVPVTLEVGPFSVRPALLEIESQQDTVTFQIENHSLASLAWTASETLPWLTVSPAAGAIAVNARAVLTVSVSRNGLATGMYSGAIRLTAPGPNFSIDVPITMRVPAFELVPDTLDFGNLLSGAQLGFDIVSIGSETFDWIVEPAADASWLAVDTVEGTGDATVQVTADPVGFTAGTYESTIRVSHVVESTVIDYDEVTVTMTAQEAARLTVSPSTLNFGTQSTDKLVAIWNAGVDTVDWSIDTNGYPAWLSVAPRNGVAPPSGIVEGSVTGDQTEALRVSVDRRGLAPTPSETWPIVVRDLARGVSRTIAVGMAVAAAPILTIETPDGVDANAQPILNMGQEKTSSEFTLSNTGTGSLNWDINKATFPVWLTMRPEPLNGTLTSPEEEAVVEVQVNRTGLASGDHSFEVTVTSNGGDRTFRVLMTVPKPILSVTPDALDFGQDGAQRTLSVANTGGGILTWTVTLSENTPWLSVDTTEGLTTIGATSSIVANVSRAGLQSGDYAGQIVIQSDGGRKVVPVTMRVPGPRLLVTPGVLELGVLDNAGQLVVQNAGETSQTLSWSVINAPFWLELSDREGLTTVEQDVIDIEVIRMGLGEAGIHEGEITFSSNGGSATITVRVEVPTLSVEPVEVEIGGLETTARLLIENHADASLNWDSIIDWSQWTTPSVTNWFELRPASGTIPIGALAAVDVRVLDRSGLTPGSWQEGPIAIRNVGTGYVQTVLARIRIPGFSVDTRTIVFTGLEIDGGLTVKPFVLTNEGAAPLNWTSSAAPAAPWLSLNPASGSLVNNQTVNVTVDPAGLAPGRYETTVTVESGGDANTVLVQMDVPVPPTLSATPLNIDFGAIYTSNFVAIWNRGIRNVVWSIDTSGFPSWLSLDGATSGTVSGALTDYVTLKVDRDGLTPTDTPYSYQFEIAATDGAGVTLDSLTCRVQMRVVGFPTIVVDTGNVDDFGISFINMETTLDTQIFYIMNNGTGTLFWSIGLENMPAWITGLTPSQGSIPPGGQTTITLNVSRAGLGYGGLEYQFTVDSNDNQNRSVPVNVQIQVPRMPAITVKPPSIEFTTYENSGALTIANSGDPASVLDFVVETNRDWLYFFPSTGQSIGTDSDLKDWQEIGLSIDRSKLDGASALATLVISAFELDENLVPVIRTDVPPKIITVSVEAAPLSFEVANPTGRVPSLVRFPMLMRDIQYRALPLPNDQYDVFASQFTVSEKDQPLEITETNQFLADGSRLRTNLAFLLDYSGSMNESIQYIEDDPAFDAFLANPAHLGDPLDKLQALYEYYVGNMIDGLADGLAEPNEELLDNYRIAILAFNERGTGPYLVTPFTTNKTRLRADLEGISFRDHGATELLPMLDSASAYLAAADAPFNPENTPETAIYYIPFESAEVSALVLVSDGRMTTPPAKVKETQDLLVSQKTRLFALGWGQDINHEPLARITTATGGHYYPSRNMPLLDGEGNPVFDDQMRQIFVPSTIDLENVCFTDPLDPCDSSLARDLQSQVVFSYVSLNEEIGVKKTVAAVFDNPNDGTCGLPDQGRINGSFQ
ncbi:MAG: hypothetical protein QG656_1509, partial [Candidatus Hydrogenedentes bacterium]|nr:hypothetical protein [Candidatus Hydrogenedentota bacterium]